MYSSQWKISYCETFTRKGVEIKFPGKVGKGEDWRHTVQREVMRRACIEISVRPSFLRKCGKEKEFFGESVFFDVKFFSGEPFSHEHVSFVGCFPKAFPIWLLQTQKLLSDSLPCERNLTPKQALLVVLLLEKFLFFSDNVDFFLLSLT